MSASPGALSSVCAAPEPVSARWRILVVEPTPEGRAAVFFALQDVELLGRPLFLVPAGTTVEACRVVRSAEAPAVALIDVGEEGAAALEVLLGRMRAQAPAEMRLVLWVRHPSQIPPLSMLTRHDVSDVCRRSDLTQGRLLIVLHAALCGYEQRLRLRHYREGVVEALVALEDPRSRGGLETLARGLLLQITGLLGGDGSALVASGPGSDAAADPIGFVVLGGCGRFAGLSGTSVSSQRGEGGAVLEAFVAAAARAEGEWRDGRFALLIPLSPKRSIFLVVEGLARPPERDVLDSLRRFAGSVAQAAESLDQIGRLERLAYHDSALGLPNRHGFERMLDQRLQEPGPRPVLVFCAVEGVAVIAATFGATAATQVLRAVAGVLQGPPIGLDRLARFADDSLVGLAGPDGLNPSVLEALQTQPVPVEGGMAPVRLRVACVDPGSEVREASTLSRHGQAALLAVEAGKGGGAIRYTRAMSDGLYRRLRLRTALRRSLERDRGIDVHLQPQVDLMRGTIVGAEALCRWFLDGHVVLPEEFIPLAETGGLSRALTGAVIQRVAEIGADRRALGRPALRLSVNLSAMDLSSEDFMDTLLRDIEALGLTPDLLAFEITEAQILIHPRPVLDEVAKLRRAGFEVMLDDFGTGRASLSLLERLPVTAVKIDRTFVASLTVAGASRSLVATALAMARGLGLGVVAEGVETVEQHQALAALGCEVAQGFLYGAAVPVAEFERLVGGWSLAHCLATAT